MRCAPLLIAGLLFGCNGEGALLVRISSSLVMPTETDQMVLRVLDGTNQLEQRIYDIGVPPLEAWPLVQQINEGKESPQAITVTVELRKETTDGTLLLVGYRGIDAMIPDSGFSSIDLEVSRACDDDDGDEFGLGAGCKGDDCNDDDAEQPEPTECSRPDGGTGDGGAELCGTQQLMCDGQEVCIRERCLVPCTMPADCRDPALTCNRGDPMVCVCNIPCERDGECNPGRCDDRGCCVGL